MGVQGMIMEEGNMVESFGVDGILGYSLFGDKIVEIDSGKTDYDCGEQGNISVWILLPRYLCS